MRLARTSFVRKKSFDYNVVGGIRKERRDLDQTTQTKILLDDDVCAVC